MAEDAPVTEDEDHNLPVPSQWRAKLKEIAEALREHRYTLDGLEYVNPLDSATAARIARQIEDYGATLETLPDATWETSVCQWQGDRWDVLVDLFTVEEGRSDLVLHVHVSKEAGWFVFKPHFVYVP